MRKMLCTVLLVMPLIGCVTSEMAIRTEERLAADGRALIKAGLIDNERLIQYESEKDLQQAIAEEEATHYLLVEKYKMLYANDPDRMAMAIMSEVDLHRAKRAALIEATKRTAYKNLGTNRQIEAGLTLIEQARALSNVQRDAYASFGQDFIDSGLPAAIGGALDAYIEKTALEAYEDGEDEADGNEPDTDNGGGGGYQDPYLGNGVQ